MPPRNGPRRPGRSLARFSGDARGTVAVEWALLMMPFFAILGAIIDVSVTSWVSQNLNNAVSDAARTIQTGKFQEENKGNADTKDVLSKFREKICAPNGNVRLYFISCDRLKVQVQTYSKMGDGKTDSPVDSATREWSSNFGNTYTSPDPSTITVMQVAAKYPVWLNILNVTPTFADGSRLLQSTVVLKTEPYQ